MRADGSLPEGIVRWTDRGRDVSGRLALATRRRDPCWEGGAAILPALSAAGRLSSDLA